MIDEGLGLVRAALPRGEPGTYVLQAAIAAVHAEAPTFERTAWPQIAALYDLLMELAPSPVIELNRAVAVAMRDGPRAGLDLIDKLVAEGRLERFHLLHSARAELLRRMGRVDEAEEAYGRALALQQSDPERRFLEQRLAQLHAESPKSPF
jgi:RNA polymerase sigma-70 factor, ECF subfamily